MKKIALFVAILAFSVLATACTDSIGMRYAAKITLSDGTVISCVKGGLLELEANVPFPNALRGLSCTDTNGLHITIPADTVARIEIATTVDTAK